MIVPPDFLLLKPQTARSVLSLLLGLSVLALLLAALGGLVGCVLVLLNAPLDNIAVSLPFPAQLNAPGGGYQLSRVEIVRPAPSKGILLGTFVLGIGVSLALAWLLYRRAFPLLHRLFTDPFALENSRDLALASQLVLLWQALTWAGQIWGWSAVRHSGQLERLRSTLAEIPELSVGGLLVPGGVVSQSFWWPPLTFTPLLVSAVLALLAALFRRAHDLRQEERRLRAEQDLTI